MAQSEEPPAELVCPITQDVMEDPVMLAASHETFERAAIDQYFAKVREQRQPLLCPTTRMPVPEPVQLLPQRRIKALAEEWLANHSSRPPSAPAAASPPANTTTSASSQLYRPNNNPAPAIPAALPSPSTVTSLPGTVYRAQPPAQIVSFAYPAPPVYPISSSGPVPTAPSSAAHARSQPPPPLAFYTSPAVAVTQSAYRPSVASPSSQPAPAAPRAQATCGDDSTRRWPWILLVCVVLAVGLGVGLGVGLKKSKATTAMSGAMPDAASNAASESTSNAASNATGRESSLPPLAFGSYLIISETAPTSCLIVYDDGGSISPSLYNWAQSSYYCGWDNYANLTSNGQAVWWLNPISTDIAGAPDRYIIRAGKPSGRNSCLIISANGNYGSPQRYYWGTNPGSDPIDVSSACGLSSMSFLVDNKQAVWQIKGIPGTTNKYTIEIDTGAVSGMRCLAMLSGSSMPPMRLPPSSDGYCGYGSASTLLADKRAVWTIIAPQHNAGVCPGQDNTDWGKTTSQFTTVVASSPDDCSSRCAQTAPCFGWVYQKANGYCHLKSQDMQGNGFFNMGDTNLVAGAGCR